MKQIDRRTFIRNTAALAAGMSLASCRNELATAMNKSVKRPNILFVFPDQFRRQAMGFMGADPVVTPNLDRLASQSLVFTNACSNYPLCSPFRGMLMTGKYPYSNHLRSNCCSAHTKYGVYLRQSERCLSDVLHDAGYSTGYIGKWHLDAPDAPDVDDWRKAVWDAYTPPGPGRHGFEFWYSYGCMDKHLNPHYWINNASEKEKTVLHEWSPRHEAGVAIDFIRNKDGKHRRPDKPFALFVAMNPPHPPFDRVPQEYLELYRGKIARELLNRKNVDFSINKGNTGRARKWVNHYFAAVTGVDEQFGRILKCLADEGLAEDTIVVFTADHGEMMGSHNRMGKSIWYEEAFGIPFVIRWPGHIASGREDMPLSVPDFMPSLLGLAGLAGMIPAGVEGTDYSGVMLGKSARKADSALYVAPGLEKADIGGLRGVRTRRYFLGVKRHKGQEQYNTLFDLENDPYQLRNIADDEPSRVSRLRSILGYWLEKTSDPWNDV
jgi:arylsulfatase A-like enzyme